MISEGKAGQTWDLTGKPFKEAVRDFEIQLVKKALTRSRFNQRKAARQLGLSYDQFRGIYRKFKKEMEDS